MIILKVIWFLLPAGIANMLPIFACKFIPNWNTPVDFGKKWKKKEIFGSHKTYRGFVFGVIGGLIVFILQKNLFESFLFIQQMSLLNYKEAPYLFGAWMGFCALFGDLVKSFIKRRMNIKSGDSWIPFDQLDWIVGVLIGSQFIIKFNMGLIFSCLIVGICFHFIIKYIGYILHLNSNPL